MSDAFADMATMKSYDEWVRNVRNDYAPSLTYDVVCLGSEAGELLQEVKKHLRDGQKAKVLREAVLLECGDLLHYICRVLEDVDASLKECAAANIQKIVNRSKYGKGKHGKRS